MEVGDNRPGPADQAVEEADFAARMVDDNPYLIFIQLTAHETAMRLRKHEGQSFDHLKVDADRLASQLEHFPEFGSGIGYRARYLIEFGDPSKARLECERAIGMGVAIHVIPFMFATAPERGLHLTNAWPTDKHNYASIERLKLAAGQLPMEQLIHECQTVLAETSSIGIKLSALEALLLLGKSDYVKAKSATLLSSFNDYDSDLFPRIDRLRIMSEASPIDEIIHGVPASKLFQLQKVAGFKCLGDGDRRGARVHFQAAVDTQQFIYPGYGWAKALLALLEADAAWPPWIPTDAEGVDVAARETGSES